jgi:hypothetical protein
MVGNVNFLVTLNVIPIDSISGPRREVLLIDSSTRMTKVVLMTSKIV